MSSSKGQTPQQEDISAPKRVRHDVLLLFSLKLPSARREPALGAGWVGGLPATEFLAAEIVSRVGAQQLQSSAPQGFEKSS